jgi:hypothetical protein
MPNYGTYAICPYFCSEDAVTIKCEGIIQFNRVDATYHVRLPNKEMKKAWLRSYCESRNYLSCPYAALMEKCYDDTGKSIRDLIRSTHIKVRKSKDIKGQLSLKL